MPALRSAFRPALRSPFHSAFGRRRGVSGSVPPPAPAMSILGINESFMTQWAPGDVTRDRGRRSEWRTPASAYIRPPGMPVAGGEIAGTADGSGGSVKMDPDGRIYATNSASLTAYRYLLPFYLATAEAGVYTVSFAPGVAVSKSGAGTGWTYDQPTGIGSFTWPGGYSASAPLFEITTASIPVGGVRPSVVKQGDTHPARLATDIAITNIRSIASIVRFMTPAYVNNDRGIGETTTALGTRTPADRVTYGTGMGPVTPELMIEIANRVPAHLWYNVSLVDSDALITENAALIAAGLSSSRRCYVEFSNEIWNSGFYAHMQARLAGLRRGYAPSGLANSAAAVPETIIDARADIDRYTGVTSVAYANNARIYVDLNNVGWQVYKVNGASTIGEVVTSAGDGPGGQFERIYDNGATQLAMLRWQMKRSLEVWAIFDAAFAAVGKQQPIHVLGAFAAGGFGYMQPALEWDDGHLSTHRVATAFYWSGGVTGLNMGPYADTSVAGWGTAQKDLAVTNLAAAKDAFFAAAPAVIDATVADAGDYIDDLGIWLVGKGRSAAAIKLCQYEANQHIGFSGWPDMAAAGALFRSLMLDQRMGTMTTRYLEGLNDLADHEEIVWFDRALEVPTTGNPIQGWSSMESEDDSYLFVDGGTTNWRLKALADFQASQTLVPPPGFEFVTSGGDYVLDDGDRVYARTI